MSRAFWRRNVKPEIFIPPSHSQLGLCGTPPVGLPFAALALSNNCCFGDALGVMRERFDKLYRRKVYVHHYTQYMDQ